MPDDVEEIQRTGVTRRVVAGAGEVVSGAGEAIADVLRPAAEKVLEVAGDIVEDLAEAREAHAARRRERKPRRARTLANLFDVHPEARAAPTREVGLLAVPVDEIVGSAVDGPAQRGPDFLPLKPLRSVNWEGRWQRIRKAMNRLQVLPPIEVLQTADGYWVVDGHNRVAAAKATGQVAIDAVVRAVRLPGQPNPRPTVDLAPLLEGSGELRAAGQGLLTPGSARGAVHHDHLGSRDTEREPATKDDSDSGAPE